MSFFKYKTECECEELWKQMTAGSSQCSKTWLRSSHKWILRVSPILTTCNPHHPTTLIDAILISAIGLTSWSVQVSDQNVSQNHMAMPGQKIIWKLIKPQATKKQVDKNIWPVPYITLKTVRSKGTFLWSPTHPFALSPLK
jgi:hypothetical protein